MKIFFVTLSILGVLGYGIYQYMPELLATIRGVTQIASLVSVPKYSYTEKYTDSQYGFNFLYPKDFIVTVAPGEGGGKILLVENKVEGRGVQIVISPFDEEVQITSQFLRDNVPDIRIKNDREVTISADQKGLRFESDSLEFDGKSSELWFVRNKNLYQVSTYTTSESILDDLFATWHFD